MGKAQLIRRIFEYLYTFIGVVKLQFFDVIIQIFCADSPSFTTFSPLQVALYVLILTSLFARSYLSWLSSYTNLRVYTLVVSQPTKTLSLSLSLFLSFCGYIPVQQLVTHTRKFKENSQTKPNATRRSKPAKLHVYQLGFLEISIQKQLSMLSSKRRRPRLLQLQLSLIHI